MGYTKIIKQIINLIMVINTKGSLHMKATINKDSLRIVAIDDELGYDFMEMNLDNLEHLKDAKEELKIILTKLNNGLPI